MSPNSLIHQTSPYLLQHAHNPVQWVAWSEDAFKHAKSENKLVLISIGYSACHWCHVMERECFEDEKVAQFMNKHFVCIKVDREEHPHIDSLYMSAVQLMNKQGGWPLNCFALPDGRPIFGGTYYTKADWLDILNSLHNLFKSDKRRVEDYASQITRVLRDDELLPSSQKNLLKEGLLDELVTRWAETFDNKHGGPNRAPKFPLPNNYHFLLVYCFLRGVKLVHDHVHLTLRSMARGGIFDQLCGGFARYSVDQYWKVPHFEKMLYDNAQLISLYCDAYREKADEEYKWVIEQSLNFIDRELKDPEGAFYSALDADSDGREGVYYTWTENSLRNILNPHEYDVVRSHYNVNAKGYWEDEQYILIRERKINETADALGLNESFARDLLHRARKKMREDRARRTPPARDDKCLLSWNAMMVSALADAGITLSQKNRIEQAEYAMRVLEKRFIKEDGSCLHTFKNGEAKIDGLLEDYAFCIEAYIKLYQATFNEGYLNKAASLCQYTLEHFSDNENTLFYFNAHHDQKLIARKKEISDNVIPSGNSVMALNLFVLGNYFYRDAWVERAQNMLLAVWEVAQSYLPGYSNWAKLALFVTEPYHEIALCGDEALNWASQLQNDFLPNCLIAASANDSDLPMLVGKRKENQTLAYVCHNKFCEKPFSTFAELEYAIAHQK